MNIVKLNQTEVNLIFGGGLSDFFRYLKEKFFPAPQPEEKWPYDVSNPDHPQSTKDAKIAEAYKSSHDPYYDGILVNSDKSSEI